MLDCCYVASSDEDGRCCVYCGPNAGLWETHALTVQVGLDSRPWQRGRVLDMG